MKRTLFLLLVALPASALAQAPFCVVGNTGQTQCYYYSLDACRQALTYSPGSMCAANTQAQQPQVIAPTQPRPQVQPVQIQNPDIAGSFMRGQQAGLDAQRTREEIALMQAQRQALQTQPTAQHRVETNAGYWVMYKCPDAYGEMQFTGVPAPGCIVDHVTAY